MDIETSPDDVAGGSDESLPPEAILRRYERAKSGRSNWESHWRECFEFALPQRDTGLFAQAPGGKRTDRLFDGTAPDAVEQLAASLMAELTPPWSQWFDLTPGPDLVEIADDTLNAELQRASEAMQSHFDRSNFAVEIHQCFLDLVTAGTATLLFEEAPLGEPSAFRFTAVPVGQAVLEEGPYGALDTSFHRSELSEEQMRARFPKAPLEDASTTANTDEGERKYAVLEAVMPEVERGYRYKALLLGSSGNVVVGGADGPLEIASGRFDRSPFINFRWMKAPGEIYGRSPVMKMLPDIKTANKVVELVLKNATIAVTGIWQADDDGVLNPTTVKLLPGTIIPKAVGSSGLTPLASPGQFDVSQLVLDDVRGRIRQGLLVDKLGQVQGPSMTATEILERSTEMARLLGATYGRLQAELLVPLAQRALAILRRRGEVPDIHADGHEVELKIVSPIARHRRRQQAQSALQWFEAISRLGPAAAEIVDVDASARWLAQAFDVPDTLLYAKTETRRNGAQMSAAGSGRAAQPQTGAVQAGAVTAGAPQTGQSRAGQSQAGEAGIVPAIAQAADSGDLSAQLLNLGREIGNLLNASGLTAPTASGTPDNG